MPRFDDPQPYRDRSKLIGLIVIGTAATIFCLVAGLIALSKFDFDREPTNSERVWSRDAFRNAAMGKTPDELIATFGRPDATREHPNGHPKEWTYWDRTINPATRKVESATVEFFNDRVAEVSWF